MRRTTWITAAVATFFGCNALAQSTTSPANSSNPVGATQPGTTSSPGRQAPVGQPQTSPAPSASTPATDQTTSPSPSQPKSASNDSTDANAGTDADANPPATLDQIDGVRRRMAEADADAEPVPPAMRNVGEGSGRPDCSKLRSIEKAECERRDTTRDDLPPGVTSTQPER